MEIVLGRKLGGSPRKWAKDPWWKEKEAKKEKGNHNFQGKKKNLIATGVSGSPKQRSGCPPTEESGTGRREVSVRKACFSS